MKFSNGLAKPEARRTEDLRKFYFAKLSMENCIFCKIIKKEIPADIVHEDANFVAFLDIEPVSFGHILVIPKKHVVSMQEADDELIAGIFVLSKRLMLALKKGVSADYVQVSIVGKDVPHFHVHLFPRYFGDNLPKLPTKKYAEGESDEILKKIKSAI